MLFQSANSPILIVANDLVAELSDDQFLAKVAADMAAGKTCAHLADDLAHAVAHEAGDEATETETAKVDVRGKQVTVSSLVQRALNDQRNLLTARQQELERWNRADQARFAQWFGTTADEARQLVYKRIQTLLLLNQEYSVGNFRRAVPSRPGIFAFVRPSDPSKIFVDQAFVFAKLVGENSRAGTICHEMSHFTLAGGTKDIVYGVPNCKRLARLSPVHALSNADSFEFYVEGVR